MAFSLVTPPADEPVTFAEALSHLKLDPGDDDAKAEAVISAARAQAESFTGTKLITQTWDWTLDGIPCYFELPTGPVQSVSSLKYLDLDGTEQTLDPATYIVDGASIPARPQRITLAYNQIWPNTYDQANAITVRFVAGYGDSQEDVPAPIRSAILLLAAHFYERRTPIGQNTEVELPLTIQSLLTPYKLWGF
jgi:uncharacterized phiE125 gp8 family phage protein